MTVVGLLRRVGKFVIARIGRDEIHVHGEHDHVVAFGCLWIGELHLIGGQNRFIACRGAVRHGERAFSACPADR